MQKFKPHPACWCLLLWLLTAFSAVRVELARPAAESPLSGAAALLMTETKRALGQELYRSADIYFHRGARPRPDAPVRKNRLMQLHEIIEPSRHTHIAEGETAEILPWLAAAIRIDPENIEVWRVAAFWLSSPALNRTGEAISLLQRAALLHPDDHRPLLELGRLLLRQGKLEDAARLIERALALWRPDPPRGTREEALLEKAELLSWRGLCEEIAGSREKAADSYDRVLALFPDRAGIASRRDALRRGENPALPPVSSLRRLVEHRRSDGCHDDHCRGHHDHHHHHP